MRTLASVIAAPVGSLTLAFRQGPLPWLAGHPALPGRLASSEAGIARVVGE